MVKNTNQNQYKPVENHNSVHKSHHIEEHKIAEQPKPVVTLPQQNEQKVNSEPKSTQQVRQIRKSNVIDDDYEMENVQSKSPENANSQPTMKKERPKPVGEPTTIPKSAATAKPFVPRDVQNQVQQKVNDQRQESAIKQRQNDQSSSVKKSSRKIPSPSYSIHSSNTNYNIYQKRKRSHSKDSM